MEGRKGRDHAFETCRHPCMHGEYWVLQPGARKAYSNLQMIGGQLTVNHY